VGHKNGEKAYVTHGKDPDGRRTLELKADLEPLSDSELDHLAEYLSACIEFVGHARMQNGVPKFPFSSMKAQRDEHGNYYWS
jgi:hypothetical protein